MKKKKNYHHGDLRSACIKQGLWFLDRGDVEFSLRDIAKKVGVSHGAPARHFNNKEGLLAAIAEEGFKKFNEYLDASFAGNAPKATFYKMAESYVEFGLTHSNHYRVMFGNFVKSHDNYSELQTQSREAFSKLIKMVTLCQNHHLIKSGNTLSKSYHIWSALHGLVYLCIDGPIKIGSTSGLISDHETRNPKPLARNLTKTMCDDMMNGMKDKT